MVPAAAKRVLAASDKGHYDLPGVGERYDGHEWEEEGLSRNHSSVVFSIVLRCRVGVAVTW